MRETKSRKIGPHTYKVKQLGAQANTLALEDALRLVAPALSGGTRGFAEGQALLQGLVLGVGGGLASLGASLPVGAVWELVKKLAVEATVVIDDSTQKTGNREPELLDKMDDIWVGDRYADMYEWLAFALEVNFASFFADSARGKQMLERARVAFEALQGDESPSQPPTSTG